MPRAPSRFFGIPSTALLLAALLTPGARAQPQPARVSGEVVDSLSGTPIENATVRAVGIRSGVLTDGRGRFDLVVGHGPWLLELGGLGYRTVRIAGDGAPAEPLRVALAQEAIPLAEIVVTPGHFGVSQEIAAPRSMTRDEIQTRPQLGEDVYRTVTRLPGVISDDFSARFSVRGGANDQILTTLDGVELYEPFHLKDLDAALSVVDVEAIGGVDLVTGGFPVDRGDHLTGTFDLRTRDARQDPARTVFGVSLGNARFLSRGGFDGGRGQWLASARRGYLDVLLKLIPDADVGIEPRYTDAFAKVEWDVRPGHAVGAHLLRSSDVGIYLPKEDPHDPELHSRYGSTYGWLTWTGRFGDATRAATVASLGALSWERNGTQLGGDEQQRMAVRDLRDFDVGGVRQDWTIEHSGRLLTKVGWEWKRVSSAFDYLRWERVFVPSGSSFVARYDTVRGVLDARGHELGAYAAERVRPVRPLTLELGARWDRQTHRDEAQLSPRVNVAWEIVPRLTLRAAWGRYAQSQELFQVSVPDGDTLFHAPERAVHRVLGLERTTPSGASVRLELYHRVMHDLRPRWWNLRHDIELFPESVDDRVRVAPDSADARGVELFARGAPDGRFTWSGGYTLARVHERIDGAWVPDPVDQRHAFYVDVAFQPNPTWRLAAAWQSHSGQPYTRATASVTPLGNRRFDVRRGFGPLGGERLPAYHRMDLRVTRDFSVGKGRISVFADVFNALNHGNVRGYDSSLDILDSTGRFQLRQVPIELLPRLPSIGASWEF